MTRWPLHPAPVQGEALSSWLTRVAEPYGLSVHELLAHNLDARPFDPGAGLVRLDLDPPAAVLAAIVGRTGVDVGDLRMMTIAGWVPWLLDTLLPGPAAFNTYVRQDSVLFGAGQAPRRSPHGWRAWLPPAPMRRACPACVSGGFRGFTLVSQIPLTLSCPQHGCRLEEAIGCYGSFVGWATKGTTATSVVPAITVMDQRTHEGLATGRVTLPRRGVHVGVWLRLLRTLLDEVNIPTSRLRQANLAAVQRIWTATGRPLRNGHVVWRPYEALTWADQQTMLEAAAAAIHLTEAGSIDAGGSLAPLLTLEPARPVDAGSLRSRSSKAQGGGGVDRELVSSNEASVLWPQVMHDLQELITEAHTDRTVAQGLLRLCTASGKSQAAFTSIRECLVEAGVPGDFLQTEQNPVRSGAWS